MSIRATRVAHAVTVTVGAMAIAPTMAGATPSLTTDRSCFAETEPIHFSGQGFTPNGDVSFIFAANGRLGTASTKADATGAFQYTVGAPKLKSFDADAPAFDLTTTANDQAKLGPDGPIGPPEETFAAGQVRISEWSLDIPKWDTDSAVARRGQRFKLTTTGWTSTGGTLYLHYVRAGKAVHSEKVGALRAPCGDLTKTIKAFNFKTAKPGKYAVRFSTSARYRGTDTWLGYRAVRLTT